MFSEIKPSMAQIKKIMDKAKKKTQKITADHRELHSTVSKVGKAIDKVGFNFI